MAQNTASAPAGLSEAEVALCRSALYEALALGFRPPAPETVSRLITEEGNSQLAGIAGLLDSSNGHNGQNVLADRVRAFIPPPSARHVEALRESYESLFGHIARPAAPPYETEYGEEALFQQPHQLGDISGSFSAFGLSPKQNAHERVDHISCECEFLSFLTRKEAYALEADDPAMLEETRKAQRLFLRDHLGRFVPSFSNLLLREAPNQGGFYAALGALCRAFVERECVHYGVPLGPAQLRLRPAELLQESATCGSGDELIGAASSCGAGCGVQ